MNDRERLARAAESVGWDSYVPERNLARYAVSDREVVVYYAIDGRVQAAETRQYEFTTWKAITGSDKASQIIDFLTP